MTEINVTKRSGEREPLDVQRIQEQTERACAGLEGVSPSMIEINASLEFEDGMPTSTIQKLLIKSATNLIMDESLGHVNYAIAAGRLLNQDLRKLVYSQYEPIRLYDIVKQNVAAGMYEPMLLAWYTEGEWDQMERMIDHTKDEQMSVSQLDQLIEKYLVKDRENGKLYETPQVRYIISAAVKFHNEDPRKRLKYVKDEYESASNFLFTYATPQLAGLGTPTKQFSSCVVIKAGDSLDSIYAAGEAMGKYAAKRAGIGFDFGRVRPKGAKVRGGQVKHTGLVGFIKKWFADLRCCSQGGIRNASATFFYPIWRLDFEELIVLKNNQGTEDTRVRHLDYGVVLSGFFLKRLKDKKKITFFDPNEVPDLYEAYYRDPTGEFITLYEKYEKSTKVKKKKMAAEDVMRAIVGERNDTGRIYLMFVDNVARHVPYDTSIHPIYSSNLCMEILLPTVDIKSVTDPEALIGLCTLGSVNLGAFKSPKQMEKSVRLLVRGLSNVLAYQDFLFPASKSHNEKFRPLGIGITNLAYWMAKRSYRYGRREANQELKSWMEHISFYAIKESIELAKERGACTEFRNSKWAKGLFPWELRKKATDELCDFTPDPTLDWEALRAEMLEFGLHNMNFIAVAPVESSSVVINSTNGMEQPKALVSFKESKTSGSLVQVVPEYAKLKDKYQLLWDKDATLRDYLSTVAVVGVYTDQSMSTNTKYDPSRYEGKVIPFQEAMDDIIYAYNMGISTLYYALVEAQSTNQVLNEEDCEACKL